jgi:hypothetical protein
MPSDEETIEAIAPVGAENPSTSTAEGQKDVQEPSEQIDIEEYMEKNAGSLLEYEKQMFLDTLHSDALVVCAK